MKDINERYEEWAEDFDRRHMRDMQRSLDRERERICAKRADRRKQYVKTLNVKTNQNRNR